MDKPSSHSENSECSRIIHELRRIEEMISFSIKEIRNDIEDIRKKLRKIERTLETPQSSKKAISANRGSGRLGVSDNVIDFIKNSIEKQGFVLASQLSNEFGVKPKLIIVYAHNAGFRVIDVGRDFIITSVASLVELEKRLSQTNTTNIHEASRKAGDLSGLFDVLRSFGMVYYDARIKGWRINIS